MEKLKERRRGFITVEEIDIIVTAKIEEALKEFAKIAPNIKKQMKQVQETFSKIETKEMQNKIQHAINYLKKKVQDLKQSSKNSEITIKVNNKDAQKQITRIEKEIDSLQKKITGRQLKLDITNNTLDKIRNDTNQSVIKEMPEAGNKQIKQETYKKLDNNTNYQSLVKQSDKLNNEIEKYNALLNSAKSKMAELEQQTSKTSTTQNKLSSFFGGFKQKIDQSKPAITNMKNNFNGLPKITQNITNNIKGIGVGIKSGLGHILKYAGALVSLQSIYSALNSCANTWLSSQNAGAKQLSANIEYMKYAMGSALAPVIQFVTNLVYQLMRAIQSVAYVLTGVNIFAKASASSYASMAGSAKKAKQETKALAGIHDEINNVSTDNGDNSGGSGGGSTPNFDLSRLNNTPNSILEAIKKGNWYSIGEAIGEELNQAMLNIPWNKIHNTAKSIGTGIAKLLNGFIAKTNWNLVGNTLAQGINTVIYFGYSFITTFNWKQFGKAIGDGINGLFKNINWSIAGRTFGEGIKGIINSITSFLKEVEWDIISKNIIIFMSNIDYLGIAEAILDGIIAALSAIDSFGDGFAKELLKIISKSLLGIEIPNNIADKLAKQIRSTFENAFERFFPQLKFLQIGKNIINGIKKGFSGEVKNIGEWIRETFVDPFINAIKTLFGIHSPSLVMAEIGRYIVEGFKNGISNIWERVSSIFENLVVKTREKFTEMKTNIKDWTNNTIETIKTWAGNTKSHISEAWNNAVDRVKNCTNNVKNSIYNWADTTRQTVENWASNIKYRIGEAWNNANSIVGANIYSLKNNISSGLSASKIIISNFGSNVGNIFANLGSKANTWGKDLTINLASGIRNNIHRVTNAVSSVANKIKSYLHFTEPDEGPLSNFHTYMPDMIDLMVKGIKDNTKKVQEEIENLAGTMSYTLNTRAITEAKPSVSQIRKINVQPQNMTERFEDVLSNYGGNSNDRPIYLTVKVGDKVLGQILLDNLRDKKRRTGKDIEALVGG